MFVESVVFERIEDAPLEFEQYLMRVFLRGSEPADRAIPFVVMVGEQRVEMLVRTLGEEGIEGMQGLLTAIPQFGDEVKVGHADGPLLPTGFTFSETDDV